MNLDKKTTEYLATLKDIKLSHSARKRIQTNLHEYAAFHSVRVDEANRSIGEVHNGASLFTLKFASMPFIILLAIIIGGGTTLAAQNSVPGDILYPIKTGVNENIRGAIAMSADSEAKHQANLLEERLKEAQKLQAKGRLTEDIATKVATKISAQAKRAEAAASQSSEPVQVETKTKIASSLQNFLDSTMLDSKLVADISTTLSTSMMASDLATGLYDINAYRTDMTARTEALAKVISKNKTKLDTRILAELTAKLDSAAKMTIEAYALSETDARKILDDAANLTGEVESKLSTLGQVEIDSDTGMITDIDFSIDPMIIDRGDGGDDTSATSTSGSSADVSVDTNVNETVDTNMIENTTNGSASGSINLEL